MAEAMPAVADSAIVKVCGREILDSRGNPTVAAEVQLANGVIADAAAPSGASTGVAEAVELRDGETRLMGRGTRQAASHLNNEIAKALVGLDSQQQQNIDDALLAADGSKNKSRLGANALLAASLAAAKAGALSAGVPLYQHLGLGLNGNSKTLPTPMMNILNGGAHAANNLDVQEFMIVPADFADFPTALFAGVEIFHTLKSILHKRGYATAVGDEGGFAPDLRGTEEALDLLTEAIGVAGYEAGRQVFIALDVAASELYADGKYTLRGENFCGEAESFVEWLAAWRVRYPIISIEDGCAENDWHGWQLLTKHLGDSTQLVGDDLFATNCTLLQQGIDKKVANALLAKPNQIGTVSETEQAVRLAQKAGYGVVLSHRSGETEYADLADLAVAWDSGQIKTGAPCRGERTAKYNRLLKIADELGGEAIYKGVAALRPSPKQE